MIFKILRSFDRGSAVFRLSGRMESEHLSELQTIIRSETCHVVLDLTEVKLVDRDSIEFLARCETDGIKLTNCPAYIREWILNERARKTLESHR